MAVRAPHLHEVLRAFCLAAFAELRPETDQAGELPFVVEEHGSGFYEYRPLVRDHVLARALWLAKLPDARIAIDELRREPAAAIFARAHGGQPESSEARALFRAILLPLLTRTAGRAAASTGRTARSAASTRSSSARSSARRARTARSRLSSGSRSARRSSSPEASASTPPRRMS